MNGILDIDVERIVEVDDGSEEITQNGNREELVKQTQGVYLLEYLKNRKE